MLFCCCSAELVVQDAPPTTTPESYVVHSNTDTNHVYEHQQFHDANAHNVADQSGIMADKGCDVMRDNPLPPASLHCQSRENECCFPSYAGGDDKTGDDKTGDDGSDRDSNNIGKIDSGGDGRGFEPQKVILDCDPGVDDLLAIFWLVSAHKRRLIDILAITTVSGNIAPRLAYRNAVLAASLLTSMRGADKIKFGRSATQSDGTENESDWFYGDDGLGGLSHALHSIFSKRQRTSSSDRGFDLANSYEAAEDSSKIIVDALLENAAGSVVILAVGPLTNLARAEETRPGILSKARDIIVMGGGFGFQGTKDGYNARGNTNALAEFNFWSDPSSASKVMSTGSSRSSHPARISLVPLDVTQQVCWDEQQHSLFLKSYNSFIKAQDRKKSHSTSSKVPSPPNDSQNWLVPFLSQLIEHLDGLMLEYTQRCIYLHDPCAVGYLLYPQLFNLRRLSVQVGTEKQFKGHTWTDMRPQEGMQETNAWVTTGLKVEDFLMVLRRDFTRLAASKQ